MKLSAPQLELLWKIAESYYPLWVVPSSKPRQALERQRLIFSSPADRCTLMAAGWVALKPAWVPEAWTFRVFREEPGSCTASVLLPDGQTSEVIGHRTLQGAADALCWKLTAAGLLPRLVEVPPND